MLVAITVDVTIHVYIKVARHGRSFKTPRHIRVVQAQRPPCQRFCSCRLTGSYQETGFEAIKDKFLEADFWPGITSGLSVTRAGLRHL
jgi:hypothetical protein